MRVILDSGKEASIGKLSFTDWRRFMSEFMTSNPNSSSAWDLMGCVRGPDYPSEKASMDAVEAAKAYDARRKRKYDTIEVIRDAMFFGSIGGCARAHRDDKVTLPPRLEYDHFDKHVERGATAIGIRVIRKGDVE